MATLTILFPAAGASGGRLRLADVVGGPGAWPARPVPTCGPLWYAMRGGRSNDPMLMTPVWLWASRALLRSSRLARLLYARALDWIVRRPALMH